MKKSLITMIAALALVGVVGAGATLAYLTDEESGVVNTFAMGNVEITLTEDVKVPEGKTVSYIVEENKDKNGYDYSNITPGDILYKKPIVTVEAGSVSAYVFVKIDGNVAYLDIDTSKWTKVENGIYRYSEKVTAVEEDVKLPVFTTVTVPATLNEKDDIDNISVKAFAIQSENISEENALNEAKAFLNKAN